MTKTEFDVVILGGGLASLTLTKQLLSARPETQVLILEKRSFPVAEGAYKVGESTVEIGAHYLAERAGLKKHLVDDQLPKFGLRFFFSQGQDSLAEGVEVGTSEFFPAPGYQVDRGRLENHLAEVVVAQGATFLTGAMVKRVAIGSGDAEHTVGYQVDGESREVRSRWIVDASGRAGFLKRRLKITETTSHNVNAVWFRIGAEMRIDEWCDDPAWRTRIGKVPRRWLSTNHLLGRGYWVWIIPLASGATSLGIVADPDLHPLSKLNRFDRAQAWLEEHEPLLAAKIAPHQEQVQDFMALKRLSHAAQQVYSADRWALTGEAAAFLDPLYSPGIDYIAIGNTMICEMIKRDQDGDSIEQLAPRLQSIFLTLFENNLLTYQGQYPVFGNPRVMSLKYVWDYALYWSFPALLYFNDKLTDPSFCQTLGAAIEECRSMNLRMQKFFREWDAADSAGQGTDAVFVDQHEIEVLTKLNAELRDRLDDEALRARFSRNVEMLRELAEEIMARAAQSTPQLTLTTPAHPAASRLEGVFAALNL